MERPECDPPPIGARSVSPVRILTLEGSTQNQSATSWLNEVSCPWPEDRVPMTTSTRPGRTAISARSRGAPVLSSM
jgi:hypothetical protein